MIKKLMSAPYIIWMLAFTVLPLLAIVYYGLTNREGKFSFANVTAIFDSLHMQALLLSLLLALLCTAICLLIAYPLALILSQYSVSKSGFIVFIFILPMWMNYMLRTLALQLLLSNNGIINSLLTTLSLPPMAIINSPAAVLIGMVYDFLPFMILPIYNSVAKIDSAVIDAARDLGANYSTILKKIILPLSLPGIICGITMVFIPSISEFVIADILGGGKVLLIGNIIEQEFNQVNNWNLGSGLSLVLMAFIIVSMLVMSKFDKDGSGTALW